MDNMTTEQLLERLRALTKAREKATKGEWNRCTCSIEGPCPHLPGFHVMTDCDDAPAKPEDTEFACLAANTISPALLEAVEGLVRENRQLREQLIGPQKQPASVRQIEAQVKSMAHQLADAVQSRDLTSNLHGNKSHEGVKK